MKVKHEIRLWLAVIVICFTFLALSAAQTTQYGQSVQSARSIVSFELTSFDDKLIAFNLAWGNFYRNHFGCPPHAQYLNECFPNKTAMVDYGEFQKVVKQWEKQFAEMQKNVQTGGK